MKKSLMAAIVLLLFISTLAYAKDGGSGRNGGGHGRGGRGEVEVENENEIEERATQVPEQRVRMRKDRFDIRGTVNSISGNSIVVAGQTVMIDPSLVDLFRRRGNLRVGIEARVRGIVINNTLFAQEIRSN